MAALELILLLLAASAALRLLADRLSVPYPSLLVVGGALLAVTPGLPAVDLPPDVLFLIFIPPLLFWGAVSYPLRDFRRELGPITRLAVLMVIVSMTATAIIVHAWDPAFSWAAAFALGAIVAPPDPVAVLSMMRTMHLPRSVQSVLEGEGLFNDVTALVAYRMAVAAAVTGTFVPSRAALGFVFSAVVGVAVGLGAGVVILRAHRLARTVPAVENTILLLTPFASYLTAEQLGASGVLAVVATGMYAARAVPRIIGPAGRVQMMALWNVVTFLLESLVFILVGLQLPNVVHVFDRHAFMVPIREAAVVTLSVVVVRMIWVMPSAYVARVLGRLIRRDQLPLPPWREVMFIGWAGLRGGDSLVIALALPLTTTAGAAFPAREQIIFITFVVIFATLVLQGPTLPWVARALKLHSDDRDDAEEAHARLTTAEAGLAALAKPEAAGTSHPEVIRYLSQRHRQRARRWAAREARWKHEHGGAPHEHFTAAPSHDAGELDEGRAAEYRRLRGLMIDAEQRALLALRDSNVIGDDVMRRIERDLDFESMMLGTREPVSESPSEVPSVIEPE